MRRIFANATSVLPLTDERRRRGSWLSRLFKRAKASATPVRPKVTPDPGAAAALERRREELEYAPEQGFLRDVRQERKA